MTGSDSKNEEKKESTTETGTKKNDNASTESAKQPEKVELYGYDLYPERRGQKYKKNWIKTFFVLEGRETMEKFRCERNVYECIRTSPLVKLMAAALKSSGCEVNIRRHISCEICVEHVNGGYDPEVNQIVVCQNTTRTRGLVQGVLAHEMIHMFDYCRNNLDFKNLDHLACTEVRAANLTHCSFLSACVQGDASFINVKKKHEDCVKNKAFMSVVTARNVTSEEAKAAIDRVFPKCYADLEPVGRRIRPRSKDMYKAYTEGPFYGYDI